MAGLVEVVALSSSISQCANQIEALGNNWYKASAEWEQFPQQVNRLEEKLKFWVTECSNRGIVDAGLIQSLREAELLLKEEQRKLEKRATRCGAGCWPRVCTALFPARLGLQIQGTINAFDNIPAMLASREEGTAALDRLAQTISFSEQITDDSRYVPLKVSEAEVYNALDNPKCPVVVLLHGGAGKGKSTLARNTALHYKNKSNNPRFDHVFFLSCGPKANSEDILLELIHRLGSELLATPDDKITKYIRISKQITGLLSNQTVLIILDDVSDGEFLVEIVKVCGSGVKCMVTSQLSTLCQTLDKSKFLTIKIQDIELEDARKILASHIGLPNHQIPNNVQEVADKMILETDYNPLALASLANAIDYDRYTESKEWEKASMDFFHALHEEVKAALFHGKYPRSFWSTTRLSIDNLRQGSRNLLFLIHACEGPSIPEEIVEVLYRGLRLQGDQGFSFSALRGELKNRQLVKVTTVDSKALGHNLGDQRSYVWSVHSLQKQYVQQEMKEERDSIFTFLVDHDHEIVKSGCQISSENELQSEEDMLTTLCALYLDQTLATMAAKKVGIPIERFTNLRRNAIEPLTLLLGHPLSLRQWTNIDRASTRKVFLHYVCNGALDDSNISYLLENEIGAPNMCKALRGITYLEETCLLGKNTKGLMEVLIKWLFGGVEHIGVGSSKQEAAMEVLSGFSSNALHAPFLVSFPRTLDGLTRLLREAPSQSGHNHNLQSSAAMVLASLACGVDESLMTIINHPMVLLELVNSLSKDANPNLQKHAAWALANLAAGADDIKIKIVNHPQILLELITSLSKQRNPSLQEEAARALSNLASDVAMDDIKVKIVDHPGALSKLVQSLSKEDNLGLQEHATWALANLANGADDIKVKIVDHPGALSKLVNLLSKETNPELQENATWALANLACGLDDVKVKIIHHPGALVELVNLLSNEVNPNLQENATQVLCDLTFIEDHNARLSIKSTNRIIEGLVSLLVNGSEQPWTQQFAATTITLLDPSKGNAHHLRFGSAYEGRANANFMLGLFREALADLDKAHEMKPEGLLILRARCRVKAKMGDFQGALTDMDNVVSQDDHYYQASNLRERGVLKRMMEDLHGALADLNEGFALWTNNYEILKHRGYVKFLLKNEAGARADAEWAMRVKPSHVDNPRYGKEGIPLLGFSSVEYLGYKLK